MEGEPTYWVAGGSRMTDKPLLRVRATRFRASASSDAAMKDVNLAERRGRASDSNSFYCVRNGAVSDKPTRVC